MTPSRGAGPVVALRHRESQFSGLGEMAEAMALVLVCGPGFGCRAVRTSLAPCSVRDLIQRHFHDQVRFAVPGRKGEEGDRIGCGEGLFLEVFGFSG